MYIKTEENILTDWADWEFGGSTLIDIDFGFFNSNQDKFQKDKNGSVVLGDNGLPIDISQTQEYKDKITQEKNEILKAEMQKQIDELDRKRIRAIAEPQLKDAAAGQTWLEYYTLQIQELRNEIGGL